jgi:hypothetical protein
LLILTIFELIIGLSTGGFFGSKIVRIILSCSLVPLLILTIFELIIGLSTGGFFGSPFTNIR